MADPLGQLQLVIGPAYPIERELGRGGMATVYLARDLRHDRHVALKVLRPDLAAALGPDRFEQEIRLAARLQHPNILTVLDSGGRGSVLWFTMPYVEGESLSARLERERQLPIGEAVRLACEVADALDCAHSHGIVHRDIKPGNILLSGTAGPARIASGQDHALVTDFGIARSLVNQASDRLTQTGIVLGTPSYMSPEQASGERHLDGRSDVYSLSCVLYEMLVGEPPYTGPTAQAITAKQFSEPVPSARRLRETVPPAVDAVVRRGMARVPADRFSTAKEFGAALAAAFRGVEGNSRQRKPVLIGTALLVMAVAGLLWHQSGSRQVVTADSASIPSTRVAVLPFTEFGGDSSQKYLADGLTEETISALSQIAGLRVIARTSVMKYRGTAKTVAEIGRELQVGSVLEGSVRRTGDLLRVRVQLVDAKTQEPRWGQNYDRKVSDAFAIQNEVATRVAQELSIQPRPSEREQLNKAATTNVAAYDAYLRGLFYRNAAEAAGPAEADSAVRYFQRATARDPGFALAHAALARAYTFRLFQYDANPRWQREAFVEIEKALALDPDMAEAYLARAELSWTRANYFRAEEAIRDLRRAIVLKPNLKEAHGALGRIYYHVGLLDEGLRELRINLDLDPTDLFPLDRIAFTHWAQQQLDTALAEFSRIPGEEASRALILFSLGRRTEAFETLAQKSTESDTSYRASVRAVLLAGSGRTEEARRQIRIAETGEALSHFHHAAYNIASAYAQMGDHAAAVRWLRRTAEEGFPCYPLFAKDPALDPLRNDPSFTHFMAELKQRWEQFRAMH
jgi:serine/threonine protein kinase/tetratricopeptide (TPR) repeat protein